MSDYNNSEYQNGWNYRYDGNKLSGNESLDFLDGYMSCIVDEERKNKELDKEIETERYLFEE